MTDDVIVPIAGDRDVRLALRRARVLANALSFTAGERTLIATAISEIARNIVVHAGRGEIALRIVERGEIRGLAVIARDRGPGIADVERAMRDGFSTSGSLGLGLPGARRLMDEFDIVSVPGGGTVVTMVKWEAPRREARDTPRDAP
jgi:serine/threonine-protein kinase RsbT